MNNRENISTNLARLRKIRGFTQGTIAEQIGISRNAYRSIESGNSEPKVSNLQKIADVFDIKIYDILKPIPKVNSLRFRSSKQFSLKELNKKKQLEIDFAIWLNNFNFLETLLKEQTHFTFDYLVGQHSDPRLAASELRNKLKLKTKEPINNICDFVESIGIKIYTFKSELTGVFGMSLNDNDGGPAIGVNTHEKISVERQIFTVAHELGHIFLHPDTFSSDEESCLDEHEKEADLFASNFLMLDEAFMNEFNKNKGLHWIDLVLHIKRFYKVSYKTVLRRLLDLELVDKSVWVKFNVGIKNKYGISLKNHNEPNSLISDEAFPYGKLDFIENRMSLLAREAFEQELITLSKAAEILNLTILEMRELANSWRFVSCQR